MKVDGDLDRKRKLDQHWRELVKQLRKIDEFTDLPQEFAVQWKEMWRQEMHDIEQRRIDLSPEHKQMQKVNCGVYKTTLHCQKNVDRWAKRNEQVRNETDKAQAEMEDTGQKHQAESQVETELDLEIRGLQAGEERRGSNASQ